MKILKENFLREEELQDIQMDEFTPEEDALLADIEDTFPDEEESTLPDGIDIESQEPTTTKIWRINYKLGGHENWSRYESETKEEAEREVTKYVTNKWPDREFEILDIEEFDETELEENLNESVENDAMEANKIFVNGEPYITFEKGTPQSEIDKVAYELKHILGTKEVRVVYEDGSTYNMKVEELNEGLDELTDVQPIETGAAVGMATVIGDLIKDEYEAIDGYNSAIATAEAEGFSDMIKVLTEIQAEENLHVGQLQAIMNTIDPNAHLVDDGQQEGIEQLANPAGENTFMEESLNENFSVNVEDMSPIEYKLFRQVLIKNYGSVKEFYDRLNAFNSDIKVNRVEREEVPNIENCIVLDSSDLSQGTGNVMAYIVMNPDDGQIYMYVDY